MKRPSLLFYCQHSLGMGHLMRSLALTRALRRAFDVTLVVGGRIPGFAAIDGCRVVQLPAVGMTEDGDLVSRDGRRSVERALAIRQGVLLETYCAIRPDALVIELFPFGRRKFTAELEPLLEEARATAPRPTVCCSVRDILVGRGDRQAAHDSRAATLAARWFDCVLVHSDPRIAALQESFSPDVALTLPVIHTGFVHEGAHETDRPRLRPGGLVVSAGGGLVGERLFEVALEAQSLVPAAVRRRMHIIAGPFLPDAAWQRVRQRVRSTPLATIRRTVPKLAVELAHASGSISQCGYNTALDVLESRVPALVVPFGGVEEDEQSRRAHRLQAMDLLRVLPATDLSAPRLADAMLALRSFVPSDARIDLNGAERTTTLIAAAVDGRDLSSPDLQPPALAEA